MHLRRPSLLARIVVPVLIVSLGLGQWTIRQPVGPLGQATLRLAAWSCPAATERKAAVSTLGEMARVLDRAGWRRLTDLSFDGHRCGSAAAEGLSAVRKARAEHNDRGAHRHRHHR